MYINNYISINQIYPLASTKKSSKNQFNIHHYTFRGFCDILGIYVLHSSAYFLYVCLYWYFSGLSSCAWAECKQQWNCNYEFRIYQNLFLNRQCIFKEYCFFLYTRVFKFEAYAQLNPCCRALIISNSSTATL